MKVPHPKTNFGRSKLTPWSQHRISTHVQLTPKPANPHVAETALYRIVQHLNFALGRLFFCGRYISDPLTVGGYKADLRL